MYSYSNIIDFVSILVVLFMCRFLAPAFEGLMPRDNPRNTRFSINFFTSIGLHRKNYLFTRYPIMR